MEKLNVSKTLFIGRTYSALQGLHAAVNGPAGMYLADCHSGRTDRATASNALQLLQRLLVENSLNIAVAVSSPEVYVEFKNHAGEHFSGSYNGNQRIINWNGNVPGNDWDKLLPYIAYTLHPSAAFAETREHLTVAFEQHNSTGTIGKDVLYLFCDSFYFEFKDDIPGSILADKNINMDDKLDLKKIRGAFRTRNMVQAPALESIAGLPPFEVAKGLTEASTTEIDTCGINYEDCKAGKYIMDPTIWHPDMQKYIPSLSRLDNYKPTAAYYSIVSLINDCMQAVEKRRKEGVTGPDLIQNDFVNAILAGKPGCGKSVTMYAIGATFGMPTVVSSISKNTEESEFEGKTSVRKGMLDFVSTAFLDVYTHGGIALLEEVNLCDPAVSQGALGQALVYPFVLKENGYKNVNRHPNLVVLSAINVGVEGTRLLSQAFVSRSPDVFSMKDPDDESFIDTLVLNGYERKDCKKVFAMYKSLTGWLNGDIVNEPETALALSMRHCIAALRRMRSGTSFHTAIRDTMIGTIGIYSPERSEEAFRDLVESKAA